MPKGRGESKEARLAGFTLFLLKGRIAFLGERRLAGCGRMWSWHEDSRRRGAWGRGRWQGRE